MIDRKQLVYVAMVVSGLVANLVVFVEWNPSYVTNDGVQYLSAATNWLEGQGFSTNALMYSPHFQGGFPGPQTVWPPGYPVVLAMLGALGIKLTTAGLILNLIFHAVAGALMVLILRRMRVSTYYAIICAALFYAMAMPWEFARGLITEPLFTCLLFAVVLVLPVPGRSRFSTWILCGVFIGACIYVRYAAVVYAASVGTGIFVYLLTHRNGDRKSLLLDYLRLAALIAIPLIAFIQLMYRTYSLTGTIDRGAGSRVPETLYWTFRQWAAQSADLMGFSAGGLYSHEVGVALFLFMVLLVLSLVAYAGANYRNDSDQDHHADHAKYSRLAGFVIMAHAALLLVYLSYSSLSDAPLEILSRYLYQIYPGIYLLFCVLVYGLIGRVKKKNADAIPKQLGNALIVLIAVYLTAQLNEATADRSFFAEGQVAHEMVRLPVTKNISLATYIGSCLSNPDGGSVWSTHGQHLHFNTGAPTITLAEIYTSEVTDFQKLQKQIEVYDIRLMVFLNNDLNLNVEYKTRLQEIKDWLSNNGHQRVTMQSNVINDQATVEVFQIDQQCN